MLFAGQSTIKVNWLWTPLKDVTSKYIILWAESQFCYKRLDWMMILSCYSIVFLLNCEKRRNATATCGKWKNSQVISSDFRQTDCNSVLMQSVFIWYFYYLTAIKVTLQHSWLFTDGFSRSVYHFSFTNLGLLQSSFDCQLLCFFRVILAFSTYREQQ